MDNIKRDILWRVYIVYLVVFLFALAVIGKVVYIQFSEGKELIAKAKKQELKYFKREAVRGNIYASDGKLLATSIPIFEIRMDVDSDNISDKFFNQNVDSLAYCLSKLFRNKSHSAYKRDLIRARSNGNRYYLIKRDVTYSQLKELREFPIFRLGKYRGGLISIAQTKRQMLFKELARRTIGYHLEQEDIYVGLEGAFADVLQGIDGQQLRRRINNGDWIPVHDKNEIESENGKDIISTIDIEIQDVAENALRQHLEEHKAYQGCAILMEVETGFIRAIANLRYDSSGRAYAESYNYAIAENVEPGSTFKLASMLALLEDDKVSLSDTIDTGDGWTTYYGHTMKDAHKIGDGRISVRDAFEKSSNVGISMLVNEAYQDNPAKYVEHLYETGLNKPLGISIPGEGHPLIKHPRNKESWYGTTLPWMSIGYEVLLAPIHILAFYNAIANNGVMVKPLFVEEVHQAGQRIRQFEPEVLNASFCSQSTIDSLKSLLEGVVERGTATRLNNSIYKIAGKTGTAQIADRNMGYSKKIYNASFVGYFPADNPKYSCIVVVSKPSGGWYYGSSVAAPVFKEIADKVYSTQLDIHSEPPGESEQAKIPLFIAGNTKEIKKIIRDCNLKTDSINCNSDWSVLIPGSESAEVAPRYIKDGQVPNVIGMGAKDAIYILESLGLETRLKGMGKVKSQSLPAGSILKKGQKIYLELST
ncbi:MAG: penicillin-binding protein [Bacteroidota bacterium]|nr:penicillin-binding protein [Bacteroidota bacterium]